MPQNFLDCDREQAFLMPPSLRDWLPSDHLAWFVIETVGRLDLAAFYASYRADGHRRAAHDPAMMVCLLTYAYSTKEYSSRGIERHCRQDVAYRVITANQVPDHATVARFVARHQVALAGLFTAVLELCGKAGLVKSGVVAIDGTKLPGNASRFVNVDYDRIAREIIEQAIATDEAEDEVHGDRRGDELPEELATGEGRRAWLSRELAARRGQIARPAGSASPNQSRVMSSMPGRSSPGFRAGTGGCLRPSASSTGIGGRRRVRFRGRGLNGFVKRAGAWRRISRLRSAGTRRMRTIARRGG